MVTPLMYQSLNPDENGVPQPQFHTTLTASRGNTFADKPWTAFTVSNAYAVIVSAMPVPDGRSSANDLDVLTYLDVMWRIPHKTNRMATWLIWPGLRNNKVKVLGTHPEHRMHDYLMAVWKKLHGDLNVPHLADPYPLFSPYAGNTLHLPTKMPSEGPVSLNEFCRKYKTTGKTVWKAIYNSWPLQQVIDRVSPAHERKGRPGRSYTLSNGEVVTVAELAERAGISAPAMYVRLKEMSPDKALTYKRWERRSKDVKNNPKQRTRAPRTRKK